VAWLPCSLNNGQGERGSGKVAVSDQAEILNLLSLL